MRRTVRKNLLSFAVLLLAMLSACGLFAHPWRSATARNVSTDSVSTPLTVVIDAGHGGEDGGALNADGSITEKEINLDVALKLRDLLLLGGIPVVMTRTDDRMLYDPDSDFRGRKKQLDLAARREIAEQTENCLFVSIHMNSYPDPRYHGLQVWYSPNHPASEATAKVVQELVHELMQPENNRHVKAAGSSIYLLHRLQIPAILVECGFLSNPEEAAKLNEESYRENLAFLLFLSVLRAKETVFAGG